MLLRVSMVFGLSTAAICLILIGGFGVSIAQAAIRRDAAWVLALALPLLICADVAGLPKAIMAWGCLAYAAAGGLFLLVMIVRALGPAGGLALIAAATMLGLSSGTAEARYGDLAAASFHHPPQIGLRLEAWLRTLTDA